MEENYNYKAERKAWVGLKQRCNNENSTSYKNYGGREEKIKVCECINTFAAFINFVGKKPSKKHSLDREDNDGDYCICKNKLRWATGKEQILNQRLRPKKFNLPRGLKSKNGYLTADIRIGENKYHLGTFDTVEDANQEFLNMYFIVHDKYPPEYY